MSRADRLILILWLAFCNERDLIVERFSPEIEWNHQNGILQYLRAFGASCHCLSYIVHDTLCIYYFPPFQNIRVKDPSPHLSMEMSLLLNTVQDPIGDKKQEKTTNKQTRNWYNKWLLIKQLKISSSKYLTEFSGSKVTGNRVRNLHVTYVFMNNPALFKLVKTTLDSDTYT